MLTNERFLSHSPVHSLFRNLRVEYISKIIIRVPFLTPHSYQMRRSDRIHLHELDIEWIFVLILG